MAIHTTEPGLRRAHTVPTHAGLRRHRQEVARWALEHGQPVDRDALAAIVGARSVMADGTVSVRWTESDVGALLWSGVANWCLSHGVRPPAQVVPTLATYLRFLSGHRLLSRDSDPMTVLRRAVARHDGDDRDRDRGARSRHPAAGRRALAPVLPIC
jgi:hypothetical protein